LRRTRNNRWILTTFDKVVHSSFFDDNFLLKIEHVQILFDLVERTKQLLDVVMPKTATTRSNF